MLLLTSKYQCSQVIQLNIIFFVLFGKKPKLYIQRKKVVVKGAEIFEKYHPFLILYVVTTPCRPVLFNIFLILTLEFPASRSTNNGDGR